MPKKNSAKKQEREKSRKQETINPFERKINKQKFTVSGKKLKNAEQKTGQARSRAIDNRKKTLLVEYQQRGKVNKFIDSRWGERDEGISAEEKALIRFQKEAQKRYKKSKFNLEDGEDELANLGTTLSVIDNFEEEIPASDDEEGKGLDAKTVASLNFGGFVRKERNTDDPSKSRSDIMKDIITKSKLQRAEKQREKEERLDLMDKVDEEFSSIAHLLSGYKRIKEDEKPANDDYEKTVRELAFEVRAQATDRLKTPEEIALAEKERLEKLEKERLRRMEGIESDGEVEDGNKKKRRKKEASGDDLEANFVLERRKGPIDDVEEDNDEEDGDEGDEDENEKEENNEKKEEEDGEDYEDSLSDLEDEGGEPEADLESDEEAPAKKEAKKSTEAKKIPLETDEIPFTFPAPSSYSEFSDWVINRNPQQVAIIIHRIRTCNHVSLDPSNKQKLESFYEILLTYFLQVSNAFKSAESIEVLKRPLFEMAQQMPEQAAAIFKNQLVSMQKKLAKRTAASSQESYWPSHGELLFFKLLAVIFPVSDFEHAVTIPAFLLIGQYLVQSPVRNGKDLLSGLFLCTLALEYLLPTKRYFPEAMTFLRSLLASSVSQNFPLATIPKDLLKLKTAEPKNSLYKPEPIDFKLFQKEENNSAELSDAFKVLSLYTTLTLVQDFMKLYTGNDGFVDIFANITLLVTQLSKSKIPSTFKEYVTKVRKELETLNEKCIRIRKPVVLQNTKPKTIRSLNPRFTERFAIHKNTDQNKQRAETQKLKRKFLKEKKGAMRELRKDSWFLAVEKQKKRKVEDAERDAKGKKIMAELERQQQELSIMEKQKEKSKRF